MKKYYVSGKIARLDIGSEIEAENQYAAAIKFNELYSLLLCNFGVHELKIMEVEEVRWK